MLRSARRAHVCADLDLERSGRTPAFDASAMTTIHAELRVIAYRTGPM
jgi:hypothetical protein